MNMNLCMCCNFCEVKTGKEGFECENICSLTPPQHEADQPAPKHTNLQPLTEPCGKSTCQHYYKVEIFRNGFGHWCRVFLPCFL